MYLLPKEHHTHSGFSLIELLLVIFIVSLVYFLGFSAFEKPEKKKRVITPLTLKNEVLADPLFQGEGTLMCTDECRICYLRKDISSPFKEIKASIALGNPKVYTVDHSDNLYQHDFGRYHDNKICLLVEFYPNGSSTKLILQNQNGIFFLPSFFGSPQKVDSLDKAKSLWLSHTEDLKDRGSYY
jgi:prepilin-type N-terminal cleavage/methylation domain-containing protein